MLISFAAVRVMFSVAVRLEPVMVMLELGVRRKALGVRLVVRLRLPSESIPEPLATKVIEPEELMLEAMLVVISLIEVPPFFLLPQLVSVLFLKARVPILISSPAVIFRFVASILAAKLVKSLAVVMVMSLPLIEEF